MTRGGNRISIVRVVVFLTRKQMLTGVIARPTRLTAVVSIVQQPGSESGEAGIDDPIFPTSSMPSGSVNRVPCGLSNFPLGLVVGGGC